MSDRTMPFYFIHLSDPQLGLFEARGAAPGDGSFLETALHEKAIEAANRLKPTFVVVTCDLVQDSGSDEQHAELIRITGKLENHIPIHFTTGNCDDGNTPTAESLDIYRAKFGHNNYSFGAGRSRFVVLNSSVCLSRGRRRSRAAVSLKMRWMLR